MLDESREPFDAKGFSDRLNLLVLPRESAHAFGKRVGVSDSLIRKYLFNLDESGDPSTRVVCRIAKRLNVDLNWLCYGEGPAPDLDGHAYPTSPAALSDGPGHYVVDTDLVWIDSSALDRLGHNLPDEQRSQPVPFRRDMLQGIDPDHLAVIRTIGDSMAPTLSHGDPLLVQLMLTAVAPHDGVYVLSVDGALIVKRLQFSPFGDVAVVSDNTAYQSWKCDKEKRTELHIVARAISAIKKL